MTSLNQFFFDNNFKVEDKITYGVYRNRLLSFNEKSSYVRVTITFNSQLSKEQGQAISSKIREIKSKNRAFQNGVTTNVFQELIIYKSADFNEEFFPILEQCLDVLDAHNIPTCEVCPFCLQALPSNSPFVRLNHYVLQGHDHCINQLIESTASFAKNMTTNNKKGIFKTIITSMLVMILLVSLMIALSFAKAYGYTSLFSGWLCYLLIKFSLKKFKVPFERKHLVIVTIFSFLTILFTTYFGTAATIYINSNDVSYLQVLINYFSWCTNYFAEFGKLVLFDVLLSVLLLSMLVSSDIKRTSPLENKVYKIK